MSEVKFTDVIKCSSEDTKHRSSNLLQGGGSQIAWLCSKDNNKPTIEVELQFEKEALISFIDIGNNGSQTVDILVSHSSRCRDEFCSLVPTFNFMSVDESKQAINRTKVNMFKIEDMINASRTQSWDRLKLVCRQPYANGKQFGLSFICVKMARINNGTVSPKVDPNKNQNQLNGIFDSVKNENSPQLKKPKISMWSSPFSPSLGSLKSPKLKENRTPISPTDKNSPVNNGTSSKRTLSVAAIAMFKEEVSCFLTDVNFKEIMQTRSIKVADLRNQIEQQRGMALIRQQKILFMEIITEKLKEIKQSKVVNGQTGPSPLNKKAKDVECEKCHTMLPRNVISIHRKLCVATTPNHNISAHDVPSSTPNRPLTPRNRNRICFDMGSGDSDDDGQRKRMKTSTETNDVVDSVPVTVEDNSNNDMAESFASTSTRNNTVSLCEVDVKSMSNDNVIISSPVREIETTECPICFQQITIDKIALHASSCEEQIEQIEVDDISDLPEFPSNKDKMKQSIIEEVQCPICLKMKDSSTIEIHVNICLDTN